MPLEMNSASPVPLLCPLSSPEAGDQVREVLGGNPWAIVGNREFDPVVFHLSRQMDLAALWGELDGVA
jgi:hypothetical protein